MNTNNILSALIGSIIGISISGTFGRLSTSIKLNRIRRVIINYSTEISIPKAEKYCVDFETIKTHINSFMKINFGDQKPKSNEVDTMPMFNSDIFKSFSHEDLFRVCYDSKKYTLLVDIIYTIDFLKSNMPLPLFKEFSSKIKNHLIDKKIEPSQNKEHLEECKYFKNISDGYIDKCNLRITTTKELIDNLKQLNLKLKGNNFWWKIKYFFKQ